MGRVVELHLGPRKTLARDGKGVVTVSLLERCAKEQALVKVVDTIPVQNHQLWPREYLDNDL